MADDKLRPKLPPGMPDALVTLAAACFEALPEHRPSFALISHHMRKACPPAPSSHAITGLLRGLGLKNWYPSL